MSLKCPECETGGRVTFRGTTAWCDDCGFQGRTEHFGAKCTCSLPHHLPVWWCAVHGEVVVSMD